MPSVIPTNYEAPKEDVFPFPAPFILSAVEKDWCKFQSNPTAATVFIKRRHLEENLKAIEREIGMGEEERKKFLDHWCSPSNRNPSEIRAERDECFNIRQKAESWMERAAPKTQQPKSRLERYAESAQQFYRNIQAQAVSAGADGTQGFGYADTPDEQ